MADQWNCPVCETLNQGVVDRCIVCDHHRASVAPVIDANSPGFTPTQMAAATASTSVDSPAGGQPRQKTSLVVGGLVVAIVILVGIAVVLVRRDSSSPTGASVATVQEDRPSTTSTSVSPVAARIVQPTAGALQAPGPIDVVAMLEPPGAVRRADLFVDGQPAANGPNATLSWAPTGSGSYTLKMTIELNDGRKVETPPLEITAIAPTTTSRPTTTTLPTTTAPPAGRSSFGQATCSTGYTLVFGGRTKDHDLVVCADAGGDLEYYGIKRSTGADIRLDDACQSSSSQFTAWNGPNRYSVDSSQITVFEADGGVLLRESFQTTEEDSRPGLTLC